MLDSPAFPQEKDLCVTSPRLKYAAAALQTSPTGIKEADD